MNKDNKCENVYPSKTYCDVQNILLLRFLKQTILINSKVVIDGIIVKSNPLHGIFSHWVHIYCYNDN